MKIYPVVNKKVKELKFYPFNPRKMDYKTYESLKRSIEEFGLVQPLVINKDNEVIGGNQRLNALLDLGVEEVPCIVVDFDKSKEKSLNLALNRIVGEWNLDLLYSFIEEIEMDDLKLTGFDIPELIDINPEVGNKLAEVEIKEKNEELEQRVLEEYQSDVRVQGRSYVKENGEVVEIRSAEDLDTKLTKKEKAEYLQKFDQFNLFKFNPPLKDELGIPIIMRDDRIRIEDINELIPFDDKLRHGWAHFFSEDITFESVWRRPIQYIRRFKEFRGILEPNFSPYGDYPIPLLLYNIYRNRWLGAFYQSKGIKVIPCVVWNYPELYQYHFRGYEKGCIVAFSTIGWDRDEITKKQTIEGYKEMIKVLKPRGIISYGKRVPGLDVDKHFELWSSSEEIKRIKKFHEKRRKKQCQKHQQVEEEKNQLDQP